MSEPAAVGLPARFLGLFLETLTTEIGPDALSAMLEKAGLPADLTDPQAASRSSGSVAVETYARVQKAVRVYYGRGARGILVRVGRLLWVRLLDSAPLAEKARAQVVRTLPAAMRGKAALELLAHLMRAKASAATVHSQDLDLLLVDHLSIAVSGEFEAGPVCYVTLGLIQENLFWATARDHLIDEVLCCAAGGRACEFKITLKGNNRR